MALVLGAALSTTLFAREAFGAQDEPDEIVLRDGRRIHGRIVHKEPGRWVVIETEDGTHRTFSWNVVEEIALTTRADSTTSVRSVSPTRNAWWSRSGGGMSYELRIEVSGVLLPSKKFGLTGNCANGTGLTSASIYGHEATDRGRAAGGGLGGRVGYMYMSHIEPAFASSWWALRVSSGLDVQVLHSRIPTGLGTIDGELCAQVAKAKYEVASMNTSLLFAHVPLHFGAHIGLGKFDDALVWRGAVFGVAWSPSFVQIWPWRGGDADHHFNALGVELTVDLATLHAASMARPLDSNFRFALSFTPSVDDSQPTVATLSLGPVWY